MCVRGGGQGTVWGENSGPGVRATGGRSVSWDSLLPRSAGKQPLKSCERSGWGGAKLPLGTRANGETKTNGSNNCINLVYKIIYNRKTDLIL